MFVYRLADRLNKSVAEVLEFSVSEVSGWIGYFNIEHEENEKMKSELRNRAAK